MGGVDKKVGATLRNWKRGAWRKRGDYNFKGGTCDHLGNHDNALNSTHPKLWS